MALGDGTKQSKSLRILPFRFCSMVSLNRIRSSGERLLMSLRVLLSAIRIDLRLCLSQQAQTYISGGKAAE